ncbi:MAG: hypothetical protein ACK4UY_04005 [Dietzia sp.]
MTTIRPTVPLPAPLPYASQAGRGEVPVPPRRDPVNPGRPRLREDEKSLWVTISVMGTIIIMMVAYAALAGV